MNKEAVLKQAISRASKNGYPMKYVTNLEIEVRNLEWLVRYHIEDIDEDRWEVMSVNGIIFSPEFGIALWGEKPICKLCGSEEFEGGMTYIPGEPDEYWQQCKGCGVEPIDEMEFDHDGTTLPAYLYHQQKMLLYSEPIMYLETH